MPNKQRPPVERHYQDDTLRNPNNLNDRKTVIGGLNNVSNTLGTLDSGQPTIAADMRNLTQRMGVPDPNGSTSLFSGIASTQRSIDSLTGITEAARRDMLSIEGRNFSSRAKTLFASERLEVTRGAVEDIRREYGQMFPALVAALEPLIGQTFTESKLREQVRKTVIFSETWETVKAAIRRNMRVPQF